MPLEPLSPLSPLSASSALSALSALSTLSGWGRQPVVLAEEIVTERLQEACPQATLARGLGRSYGDASLPLPGAKALGTRLADRILAFDPDTGVLRAEAGLSLRELDRLLLPRGFASPVHTGTQYVTLGGMVAADVHGKNHHVAGTFGEHVRALRMALANGRVQEVTDETDPELFRATLGGMGLTGHVLEVELVLERIPSPWIRRQVQVVPNIEAAVRALRAASREWPFTVCALDSTSRGASAGRGVLFCGRWAEPAEAPARPPAWRQPIDIPFEPPRGVVNGWSARLVNAFYHHGQRLVARDGVVHPRAFFHPLDGIGHWNLVYGRRGMIQYQCVLPAAAADAGLPRLLEIVRSQGAASPITVLKDCGPEGRGLLSFPLRGLSLSLDFPYHPERSQRLVDALNELVIELGGRIYLAKDALTRPEHYRAMEPRLPRFLELRKRWDPEGRIRSALAARLMGDPR